MSALVPYGRLIQKLLLVIQPQGCLPLEPCVWHWQTPTSSECSHCQYLNEETDLPNKENTKFKRLTFNSKMYLRMTLAQMSQKIG